MKSFLRSILGLLYRVEVRGIEHLERAGPRVLVVANHTSFLDAILLAVFLPGPLTFAVNTFIARRWWMRPLLALVEHFPMDPTNPLSTKALIKYLRGDRRAVIFPEGRITVTGSLMKIYDGTGLVADRSGAVVVPVRIDGAQYTPFSRLRGRVRLRWFPPVTLTVLAPVMLSPPATVVGRARRKHVGRLLADIMTDMMFATSNTRRSLFEAFVDARRVHGGRHLVVEDIERQPLGYDALLTRCTVIGRALAPSTTPGERVALLLPSTVNAVAVFMGLQAIGRVPAMLNYTIGSRGLLSACETARIRTVLTSRRFITAAKLEAVISELEGRVSLIYMEDVAARLGPFDRVAGALIARLLRSRPGLLGASRDPDAPAVVLFTSGSEGAPKGVVLSHANLLANREQLAARVDFNAQDIVLNALPLFHSFGLTAATLLPLLSGMRTFFYPSPLHYRIVPEIAYDVNATILFGTNTFLTGYARFAHPYDFYSVRYVFAGAERVHEETRRVWSAKFGLRILEGYGATETSPVLAANTPMDCREGTVGRLLPGIEHALEPVPGVDLGGRLHVRGPNVMLGYLRNENPGVLEPPSSGQGAGWYDTGDIVTVSDDGFVEIRGRAKRFAKIGGEMVSLTSVEELVAALWPDAMHAVVSVPDPAKGEQLILLTTHPDPVRADLVAHARKLGVGEINVPRTLLSQRDLPVLGTGKVDYVGVAERVAEAVAS